MSRHNTYQPLQIILNSKLSFNLKINILTGLIFFIAKKLAPHSEILQITVEDLLKSQIVNPRIRKAVSAVFHISSPILFFNERTLQLENIYKNTKNQEATTSGDNVFAVLKIST